MGPDPSTSEHRARAWPEDMLPEAETQFRGLLMLDNLGAVTVARWRRWMQTQAGIAVLLGLPAGRPNPFDPGVDDDPARWIAQCAAAFGIDPDLEPDELASLAQQCFHHHAMQLVDVLIRPATLLDLVDRLRRVHGDQRWWLQDVARACDEHGVRKLPGQVLARHVPWLSQACLRYLERSVDQRPPVPVDPQRADRIMASLPDWEAVPRLSLDAYRSLLAGLPLPTDAQIEAFVGYAQQLENWPDCLRRSGGSAAMIFFLDPNAGLDRCLDLRGRAHFIERTPTSLRVHRSWRSTVDYRQSFGRLSLACASAPEAFHPVTYSPSRLFGQERTLMLDAAWNTPLVWDRDGQPRRLPEPVAEIATRQITGAFGATPERPGAEGLRQRDEARSAIRALCRLLQPDGAPAPRWSISIDGALAAATLRVMNDADLGELQTLALDLLAAEQSWQASRTQPGQMPQPPGALGAADDEQRVGHALARIGRQLRETEGALASAILLLQTALRVQLRCLGDAQRVAVIHNELGLLFRRQERYADAVAHFREAHGYFVRWHDARHPDYLTTLHNLGANLLHIGKTAAGETALRRALTLQQQHRCTSAVDMSNTCWILGASLAELGEAVQANGRRGNEEGLELLTQAWQMRCDAGQQDTLDAGLIALSIGRIAERQGLEVRALQALHDALDIHECTLGKDDARTRRIANETLQLARRCDDPATIAEVLRRYEA